MNNFGAALIALGIGIASASFATINTVSAQEAPPPVQPATPVTNGAPKTTEFGALDYFQTSCARCHGEYGMFYGDTFGKKLDDAKMYTVVHDMAFGPAQAPLEDKNMEVLVAWHRALRDQKPFISVVKTETTAQGLTLSGEVSPDATLTLNGTAVPVEDHHWKTTISTKSPFQLVAKVGDKTTTLDATASAYSNPLNTTATATTTTATTATATTTISAKTP